MYTLIDKIRLMQCANNTYIVYVYATALMHCASALQLYVRYSHLQIDNHLLTGYGASLDSASDLVCC